MNENAQEAPVLATPAARGAGGVLVAQIQNAVLGPDETRRLRSYLPYAPSFDMRTARRGWNSWQHAALGGGIAAVVVLAAAGALRLTYMQQTDHLARINDEITKRQNVQVQYDTLSGQLLSFQHQLDAMNAIASHSVAWSGVLDDLQALTPPDVRYDHLKASEAGDMELTGTAAGIKTLGNFMLNLRGSGRFYHLQLNHTDLTVREDGRKLYTYQLAFKLKDLAPPAPAATPKPAATPDPMSSNPIHDKLMGGPTPP